ncbi:MAG: Cof-type HAD-IIB family hydrolase [Planctomycetota bacterium]|nr:Cof-type HAD-IIB family hydrolase [Planctomycetota bacterium]
MPEKTTHSQGPDRPAKPTPSVRSEDGDSTAPLEPSPLGKLDIKITAGKVPAPKLPAPAPISPMSEPIDLIALDIDGTLLRSDKRMSKRVLHAVHQARDKGVQVILATARPPRSVREIHQYLGLDTPQINYNGALIHDPVRKRHLHHQPLNHDLAMKVVKLARRIFPATVVSVEILDRWYTDHVDETLPTETSRVFAPDFVGPLEAFLHVPVTKLMLLAPAKEIAPIREEVERKFLGRLAFAVSDAHLLQVIHPEADKAHALAWIAKRLNIPAKRVMAIGDAPNDVGMLSWAGLGVAVGNAWPEARRVADVVVPGNDEDGVAHAIEQFVLYRR